jgi:hypothetical protein
MLRGGECNRAVTLFVDLLSTETGRKCNRKIRCRYSCEFGSEGKATKTGTCKLQGPQASHTVP